MQPIFQQRLRRRLNEQTGTDTPSRTATSHLCTPATTPTRLLPPQAQAMLVVSPARTVVTMNPAAAQLLGVSAEVARGVSLDTLAGGVLSAIALHPEALNTTTLFPCGAGRLLVATARLLHDRNQHMRGWVVVLEQEETFLGTDRPRTSNAQPVLDTLQHQIRTLKELIAMMPKFSHHPYWRELLIKHMEQVTSTIGTQLQDLNRCLEEECREQWRYENPLPYMQEVQL